MLKQWKNEFFVEYLGRMCHIAKYCGMMLFIEDGGGRTWRIRSNGKIDESSWHRKCRK